MDLTFNNITIASFVGGFIAVVAGTVAAAETPAYAIARAIGHSHPTNVSFAGDGEIDVLRAVGRGTISVRLVGNALIVN